MADTLPLVSYHATLRAPAWGPYAEPLELDGDFLHVQDIELREELGEPWSLAVSVASTSGEFDPSRLVGADFTLHLLREDKANAARDFGRYFHGIVKRSAYIGSFTDAFRARLYVGPAIEMLAHTRRSRIFQDRTVVEIVQEVAGDLLEARGRELDVEQLVGTYTPRDYCVQYQEDDLSFVQRVLAEEGISLAFEADDMLERTVLLDDRDRFRSVLRTVEGLEGDPDPQHVCIRHDRGELGSDETIDTFTWRRLTHSARASQEQWDWKQAAPDNFAGFIEPDGGDAPWQAGEVYQHAGRRLQEADGGDGPHMDDALDQATRAQHRISLDADHVIGSGNVMSMTPAATFDLDEHPDDELNGAYYCLRVTHHGENAELNLLGGDGATEYYNEFTCASLETPYTPALKPRPRVFGVHTATVVGPASEEIHVDEYGRIKVRMHWDREQREQDDDTSCWLRVMQPWAGPGFGTQFIPRIGMEVLINFLDGDADRPVCVGSVYNGKNMPPYATPDEKTKSGIKTQSSPGGDGFNELRFNDAAGSEEVFLRAQKDLNEQVLNAHGTTVGATQTLSVKASQTTNVGGARTVSVTGDQTINVGRSTEEEGDKTSSHTLTVIGDITQQSEEGEVMVSGPTKITVFCGVVQGGQPGAGSKIEMTPQDIKLIAGNGATISLAAAAAMGAAGGATGLQLQSKDNSGAAAAMMHGGRGAKMLLDEELTFEASELGAVMNMSEDIFIATKDQNASLSMSAKSKEVGLNAKKKVVCQSMEGGQLVLDPNGKLCGTEAILEVNQAASSVKLTKQDGTIMAPSLKVQGMALAELAAATVKIN